MSVYWLACATENPPRFFAQDELYQLARYEDYSDDIRRKARILFRASGVQKRAMWFDEESYTATVNADYFHSRYLSGVREIAPKAAKKALDQAGLKGSDIDFLIFVSCTGYTCPGLSLELAAQLGVLEDRPTASFLGMGCSALVPSLARASDFLIARPGTRALVIAAEICSSTYWLDPDLETATGNALFGDGAAAIVLSSRKEDAAESLKNGHPIARLEGFKTLRDSRYLHDMGFTQKDGRLRVRLARDIPDWIIPLVYQIYSLMELPQVARVAIHPGGKRILDILEKELQTRSPEWGKIIGWSREILRNFGNMSSPTVAFVLNHSIVDQPVIHDEVGGMITMGPGLSVEGVRMRWQTR